MGKGFRELKVWQRSKDLAVRIYQETQIGAFKNDFGLRDQVCRSAVSVPSNIAEGDERDTDKDAVRFFYIAKGSLAELETQLEIAHEIGYLNQETITYYREECAAIGRMLGGFIKARVTTYRL